MEGSAERPESTRPGVYLVGAGPGDPELLTVKARRLLAQADVLIHDQLISPEVLALARPGCERIFVGKTAGESGHTQAEIERLLIARGRANAVVVRLKGGDPGIFGRGGEEAVALLAAVIAFEIVPGVTAALGAAAYAGIPLTHRHQSSAVIFLTGHEDPDKPGAAVPWGGYGWPARHPLRLHGSAQSGHDHRPTPGRGSASDTPAALIQAATTAEQRVLRATVAELAERAVTERFISPALAIIGRAAAFADTLAWFEPGLAAACPR